MTAYTCLECVGLSIRESAYHFEKVLELWSVRQSTKIKEVGGNAVEGWIMCTTYSACFPGMFPFGVEMERRVSHFRSNRMGLTRLQEYVVFFWNVYGLA